MSSTKTVSFGSQQEAIISPKGGHMIESVKVINTVNNELVPSELVKISETPAQWACRFTQPAGNVAIKAKIVPILYTVTIEECDNCNIVLIESDDFVNIETNPADEHVADENSKATDMSGEATSNFNSPQHSFENGVEQTLDVEGENESLTEIIPAPDNEEVFSENIPQNASVEQQGGEGSDGVNPDAKKSLTETVDAEPEDTNHYDSEEEAQEQDTEENNDVVYDAGEFEADLVKKEPVKITQAEYEKKCSIFFDYREAYARGDISEEKYREVERKHNQLFLDIDEGRVIVLE